jgi:hypothetical protein
LYFPRSMARIVCRSWCPPRGGGATPPTRHPRVASIVSAAAEGLVATFLLAVREAEVCSQGFRLSPGIRLSQTGDRPAIASMMQEAELELRRPDETTRATTPVTYGVSACRGEDGAFYPHDNPADAESG